jgi:hypothetical protein
MVSSKVHFSIFLKPFEFRSDPGKCSRSILRYSVDFLAPDKPPLHLLRTDLAFQNPLQADLCV